MGWSQDDLAAKIGTTQSTIDRIEKNLSKKSKYLYDAAIAVGITDLQVPQLERILKPVPQEVALYELPVYAAAEGGNGEMVVSTDPIERVPRPWYVSLIKEAYAVLVVGESMIPEYEPGQIVIVNPKLPPARNKSVILVAGEEHGEFRACLKRLRGWSNSEWQVEQFNPPKKFNLPKSEWPRALRIVGKYDG